MITTIELKFKHYRFKEEDALILRELKPLIEENFQHFFKEFSSFIFELDYVKLFINNESILQRYKILINKWVLNLFSGLYDEHYFLQLQKIGQSHIKIHLPLTYVNASFCFIRCYFKELLIQENRFDALSALDKILDINFDILTINTDYKEQSQLLNDAIFLRNCVKQKSIQPYFQPIYDAKKIEPVKYESLMRLIDIKSKNAYSIFPYLNLAKKTQLYRQFIKIMIEKVFETFYFLDVKFSINLCYEDVEDENFCNSIIKRIEEFPSPHNIVFEITETDCVKDFSIIKKFVFDVRKYGCQIAIDDFGSGFSSLENILKLKPEVIKIDGTLIKNLDTSKDAQMIVTTIVEMAKGFDAKTVAEYVCSKSIYDIVIRLGVDYLQGYYLGKPKAKLC
jgi:EAL domain-containing protein (putative c-di-GMP-specific phosphodiesterase class I)